MGHAQLSYLHEWKHDIYKYREILQIAPPKRGQFCPSFNDQRKLDTSSAIMTMTYCVDIVIATPVPNTRYRFAVPIFQPSLFLLFLLKFG